VEKKILFLILYCAISAAGCGVKIKTDPIKVDKIVVEHRIILDTDALYKAYKAECLTAAVDPANTTAVNKCADDKINAFLIKYTSMG